MASIYLDVSISQEADWDDVVSAVLEHAEAMVADYKVAFPNRMPSVGDEIDFEIKVKVKDAAAATNPRSHKEIVIAQSPQKMTYIAGAISSAPQATANAAPMATGAPAHTKSSLWGPPSAATPTKVSTPVSAPGKQPSATSKAAVGNYKCFACGKPAVQLFSSVQCTDPNCKGLPKSSGLDTDYDV